MSEKIYAWLLKLYPMRFREEYGASALQLFRDRLGTERGVFRRFRFWFDVIADLAISVPREHWRRKPSAPAMGGSFRISEEAVAAMTKRGALAPAVFVSLFVVLGLTMAGSGIPNTCSFSPRTSLLRLSRLGTSGTSEGSKDVGGATN
jgi:hypothetical protein